MNNITMKPKLMMIVAAIAAVTSCKKETNITPKVNNIEPDSGVGNTLITVSGSGLRNIRSAILDLGNVPITINQNFNTDNTILFRVPMNANVGAQHIVFTNGDRYQYSVAFSVK